MIFKRKKGGTKSSRKKGGGGGVVSKKRGLVKTDPTVRVSTLKIIKNLRQERERSWERKRTETSPDKVVPLKSATYFTAQA